MFNIESISPDRRDDLAKLALEKDAIAELQTPSPPLRGIAVQQLARRVLGLEITCDIADLDDSTSSELLLVMQIMRDAVFTSRSDDTMEPR